MMKNAFIFGLFFLIVSFAFNSCKEDDELSPEELLVGNWENYGTDDNGSFTMHLTINADNTGNTDMYEFVPAEFTYKLADGKITVQFAEALGFDPNPFIGEYTFINNDKFSLKFVDEDDNSEYVMEWVRVE